MKVPRRARRPARDFLGRRLTRLIKEYHEHRNQQYRQPWDEAADLRRIERCWSVRAIGGGFQSCCGTFHFYIRGRSDHVEVAANRYWQPRMADGSVPGSLLG